MREPTAPYTSGASGHVGDEGAGLDDVPTIDDEEGVEMDAGIEYDSCKNGVKVVGDPFDLFFIFIISIFTQNAIPPANVY
ncbi:hypothetical protein M9H77_35721 [Catharanthus roseus]|uniref:Uncharacterized protein n=1 Tax=Catharanthus roseus TaxID=4058 RepID=A0ACB9ZPT8_CATRO|nr:hypothetical protein M9H77_35721 [Catharanthus roseus]